MQVDPGIIKPSQDFLKPDTIRFIEDCILTNNVEQLPPNPIIRMDKDENLIAIDGHNLIAYMAYIKRPINVHVAKSKDDGLEDSSEVNKMRNIELANKFDAAIKGRANAQANGISSFNDLINKYPELFK